MDVMLKFKNEFFEDILRVLYCDFSINGDLYI